jgi:ABC-type branched-subunit amino acid transport system ATPase component/ABC-type branched-subunit amino acid transport system permease subunit
VVLVVTLLASGLLWLLLQRSRLGLEMRAVVDRPGLAALRGIDPGRTSAISWALGSLLAGLAGVAGAPVFNSLAPSTYTAIVFVATAAAVAARLRSVPLALAAGLLLGVAQNLVTGYVGFAKEIAGLGQAAPFLVLLGGLALLTRTTSRRAGTVAEEATTDDHRLALPAWRRRLPWVAATAGLVVYIEYLGDDYWIGLVGRGLALSLIFLSFVVVSGQGGMVSLAQAALVTAAGLTAGLTIVHYEQPWIVGLLAGVVVAVLLGVVVALPALRLGGLALALATLALGLVGDTVLFAWPWFRNGTSGWSISRPELGPLDLGDDKVFSLVVLALILLVAGLVHNLDRSSVGREIAAVRASEVAAATSGVSPVRAKLRLFALSSGIAGLGGVLLATFDFNATPSTYTTTVGLGWLAAVVLWGVRRTGAAVIAGLAASLFPALLASGFTWPDPVPSFLDWGGTSSIYVADILFGLGAVQMAKDPDGILSFFGGRRARAEAKARAKAKVRSAPVRATSDVAVATAGAAAGAAGNGGGTAPVLEVRGVDAGYGEVGVLHGIDLALAPGEITVLIGANGAGKSTLCAVLGGFVEPAAGSVHLAGDDVTAWPTHRRARAGMLVVPESRGTFPGLSVEDNLALWLTTEDQRRSAYERFPVLRERRAIPALDLSGGEQQMVTLAAAGARPPALVVADEPTLGLAPLLAAEVMERFAALRDEGVALLLVEERAGLALGVADRAVVLERGEIVWQGRPTDLADTRLAELHLGRDPIETAEPTLVAESSGAAETTTTEVPT